MRERTIFLGIDVGTSGSKAILIDATGSVLAKSLIEYQLHTPKPLWSEQNPHDWWQATVQAIQNVLTISKTEASDISCIGLTGQMHGLVLLDQAGEVLRPAILWNDQRTGAQCDKIHNRVGIQRVIEITGKPALTGFTAPKILWVREHEPHIYKSILTILLPKDYIRYRLTGSLLTDVADASGTSLFDVGQRTWSDEMIQSLDITHSWLPEAHESPVISARVDNTGSKVTGLLEGTPVVAGAGDQAAEAVGCGIVNQDVISVTVGTSGVVFAAMPTYDREKIGELHGYCHAVPNMWHVMGVMLSAGGSLRWYRDNLVRVKSRNSEEHDISDYDALIKETAAIPPGCEGLLFLPYLMGERTPYADPLARGAFIGLTMRHTRAHLTRAVLEGIAFGLKDSLERARKLGIKFQKIRISGGGARSKSWREIMANVFQSDVTTVNVTEGAAYGAALLAATGGGAFDSVPEAVNAMVLDVDNTKPGESQEIYQSYYQQYSELYPALSHSFHTISALDA